MKRKQVPQISNLSWFPNFLREDIHGFMTWFVNKVNAAQPFLPVIEEGLHYADKIVVVQMQFGAGFETVDPLIDSKINRSFVDRKNFKAREEGLYLIVNSFHQLKPEEARNMLAEISEKGYPVAVLEGNNDSLWQGFGMLVIVPLTVILTAPFVKPFRFSRIIFTYLVPILPLITMIDGFLALFKLYTPKDLDELVRQLTTDNYTWKSGKIDNGRGGKIIYLLGHPVKK